MTSVTRAEEALRAARRTGYLEFSFSEDDISEVDGTKHEANRLQREWEAQCAAEGRLPVSVGRIRDLCFIALPAVRASMREAVREVFILWLGTEPTTDGDAWYSLLVPRAIAVNAVRALIVVDHEDRARSRRVTS